MEGENVIGFFICFMYVRKFWRIPEETSNSGEREGWGTSGYWVAGPLGEEEESPLNSFARAHTFRF